MSVCWIHLQWMSVWIPKPFEASKMVAPLVAAEAASKVVWKDAAMAVTMADLWGGSQVGATAV